MIDILTSIICSTFETQCGRWQEKQESPKGLLISFGLRLHPDEEEGFRDAHLLIFAPANYVQVWVHETYDVLTAEDDDYNSGMELTQLANHDSGWRDSGVRQFLLDYKDRLLTLKKVPNWYRLVDVPNCKVKEGVFKDGH